MGRKIILHIGAAKTGTSAIQAFLRINHKSLLDRGFLVPDRLLGTGADLTGEHVFAIESLIVEADKNRIKRTFDSLDQDVEESKAILISAENLSNPGVFVNFQEAFRNFDARVVIYIRRQDDILTSSWQQWYSKVSSDFFAYLIDEMPRIGHWDQIIQGWESVVGEGNVCVRIFDRADLIEGDLLHDFSCSIGIDQSASDVNYDIGYQNPSFSDLITPLVAGNRHIFEGGHDNRFYEVLEGLTGHAYVEKNKVSLLTREQRESVLGYYESTNQRVCEKYFPDRERLFSEVNHQDYQYLDHAELNRRQLQFLTHLIYKLATKSNG